LLGSEPGQWFMPEIPFPERVSPTVAYTRNRLPRSESPNGVYAGDSFAGESFPNRIYAGDSFAGGISLTGYMQETPLPE